MFTDPYSLRNFRITLTMVVVGVIAGLVYAALSDGFDHAMPHINAAIGGALLGLYTSVVELHLLTPRFRRRIPFLPLMGLRIFIYSIMTVVILFLVFSISRALWFNRSYQDILHDQEFTSFIGQDEFLIVNLYALVIIAIVTFTYQIVRKIGLRFLVNMVTGKYYYPNTNQRIFMFIQIIDGTSIAQNLGTLNYFNFVNEIVYDITPAILSYKAHIYQYVDNEMVIYWHPEKGRENASCIRTFFSICDRLYEKRESFYGKYHVTPHLKAALHIGEVVQGEIGHGKTEIDFYGDVLNTTSRMCNQTTREIPFLISEELLNSITLPPVYNSESIGQMHLKGKSRAVSLYSINECTINSMPA